MNCNILIRLKANVNQAFVCAREREKVTMYDSNKTGATFCSNCEHHDVGDGGGVQSGSLLSIVTGFGCKEQI